MRWLREKLRGRSIDLDFDRQREHHQAVLAQSREALEGTGNQRAIAELKRVERAARH